MDHRTVLPAGVTLDGKYRIERVIGAGGFGITYAAHDIGLNTTIALKEYYPTELSVRDNTMSVRAKGSNERNLFERLRLSFVQEARLLAKFRHPSIVRVLSVFEAHGTAYMAMEFEDGRSLKSWMKTLGRLPTQDELDRIFMPLLDALEVLHEASFLHRDVAPDNIIIRENGTPVLLDFGAARRVAKEQSHQMTGLVKQGYSPQEQYTTDGKQQGPWTDIYALGATLYHLVTGAPPPESTIRFFEDTAAPAASVEGGDYRPEFLAGIDHAISVRPADRPQSIAELRPLLFGDVAPPVQTSRPRTNPTGFPRDSATTANSAAAGSQGLLSAPAPLPQSSAFGGFLKVGAVAGVLGAAMFGVTQLPGNPLSQVIASFRTPAPTASSPQLPPPRINPTIAPTNTATQQPAVAAPQPALVTTPVNTTSPQQQATAPPVPITAPPATIPVTTAPPLPVSSPTQQTASNNLPPPALPSVRDALNQSDNLAVIPTPPPLSPPTVDTSPRDRVEQSSRDTSVPRREEPGRDTAQRPGEDPRQADEALREAIRLASGAAGSTDHVRARSLFETAASAGRSEAMAWLGRIHLNGLGTTPDPTKAREWFEKAATAGDVGSMAQLGQIYQNGQGTTQDLAKAREWYERASASGHQQSIHTLGTIFYHGQGTPQDHTRARELFERAAQNGNVQSMLNLAHIYKTGVGLPQADFVKAREWYERAAAGGHSAAMNQLGVIFNDGLGTQKDQAAARTWFERGVTGGNGVSMWNLAKLLNSGQGGAPDYPRAAKLMLQATQQGGLDQLTQEFNGNMAKWHKSTRTEIKRELKRLGHYAGQVNDIWDDAAKKAISAFRGSQRQGAAARTQPAKG